MKKVVVLLLTVVLLISSLAGCSPSTPDSGGKSGGDAAAGDNTDAPKGTAGDPSEAADPSSWPTVSFPVVPTVEVTDEAMIEKALNDYLISINAGVLADMVVIDFGNLSTVMTLMLSSNEEPIDLFSYIFWSNLSGVVSNDQVIPLDELLSQYPEIVQTVGEENMMLGRVNGTQYAIPVVGSYATAWYYVLRRDIAEEIGVADRDGEMISLDELSTILTDAKAAHSDLIFLPITEDLISVYGYDNLGDADVMGALKNNGVDTSDVIDFYNTDDFEELCRRTKDFEAAGFLLNDPLNQSHDKSYLKTGVAGGSMTNGYDVASVKDDMTTSYNFDPVVFQLSPLAATCGTASGAGYCISSVSQNPDAAMKMLSLMYTDENVMRFMAQGIEGTHYVVDENGCSWFPEGKSATELGWGTGAQWYFPNQTLTIPFGTKNVDIYKDMLASNDKATRSTAFGFVFDNAPVYDYYVAVDTVIQQYRPALLYGQVNVDEYLEQFRQELKDAGIDKVIEEKQKQLEAFLAENK